MTASASRVVRVEQCLIPRAPRGCHAPTDHHQTTAQRTASASRVVRVEQYRIPRAPRGCHRRTDACRTTARRTAQVSRMAYQKEIRLVPLLLVSQQTIAGTLFALLASPPWRLLESLRASAWLRRDALVAVPACQLHSWRCSSSSCCSSEQAFCPLQMRPPSPPPPPRSVLVVVCAATLWSKDRGPLPLCLVASVEEGVVERLRDEARRNSLCSISFPLPRLRIHVCVYFYSKFFKNTATSSFDTAQVV